MDNNTALTTTGEFESLVMQSQSKFAELAPKWMSVERLTKLALLACSRQPALKECTKESFLGFCMKCAETGLEPCGAGGAWPVPFKNKYTGKKEVTFIPDYRGLIQLAKRKGPNGEVGQIKHAYGEVVCKNDFIKYEKGDSPRLVHEPALSKRGEIIGAYCVCVLPDDSKHIEYMDTEELDAIKNRSKAKDEGPWVTDEAQMYIKTVVKRALKVFAASPQIQTAIEYDNQAIGLAMPENRPPVAMPKVIEATTSEPAPEKTPDSAPSSAGAIIGNVTTKTGTSKAGKDWTRYGIEIGGVMYGTFDDKIGKQAQELKGKPVVFTFEQDDKYKTIKTLKAVPVAGQPAEAAHEEAGQPPPADDDDNLPLGHKPGPATVTSVAALEADLKAAGKEKKIAQCKKALGMASDVAITDLPPEFLENLAGLYRAAL